MIRPELFRRLYETILTGDWARAAAFALAGGTLPASAFTPVTLMDEGITIPGEGTAIAATHPTDIDLNGLGQVTLTAYMDGLHQAVVRIDGGSEITVIAAKDDAPPEGNGFFSGFSPHHVDQQGRVLFRSRIRDSEGAFLGDASDTGLYRGDGGPLETIIRAGEPAFSTGFNWLDVWKPSANANGTAVFEFDLADSDGVPTGSGLARLSDASGLEIIALEGDPAPPGGTWTGFGERAIFDDGRVLFIGYYKINLENHTALFLLEAPPSTGIQLFLEEGPTTFVSGTVHDIEFTGNLLKGSGNYFSMGYRSGSELNIAKGYLLSSSLILTRVIGFGDPLPGAPHTVSNQALSLMPKINTFGDAGIYTILDDGSLFGMDSLSRYEGGAFDLLVLEDQVIPTSGYNADGLTGSVYMTEAGDLYAKIRHDPEPLVIGSTLLDAIYRIPAGTTDLHLEMISGGEINGRSTELLSLGRVSPEGLALVEVLYDSVGIGGWFYAVPGDRLWLDADTDCHWDEWRNWSYGMLPAPELQTEIVPDSALIVTGPSSPKRIDSLLLDASGSDPVVLKPQESGAITTTNGTTIANGQLSYTGGVHALHGPVELTSNGSIELRESASVTLTGPVSHNGDTIHLADPEAWISCTGSVTGSGSFTGPGKVFFGSTYDPGNSAAQVTFGGQVFYESSAEILMEVGGTVAGEDYDQLVASDSHRDQGATFSVSLVDGFIPSSGDSFALLLAPAFYGTFNGLILPDLPDGLFWDDTAFATSGVLRVLPAPPDFETYRDRWSLPATIGGDFDKDDLSDYLEYVLGLNPTRPSAIPANVIEGIHALIDGEQRAGMSLRLPDLDRSDVRWRINGTADFSSWNRIMESLGSSAPSGPAYLEVGPVEDGRREYRIFAPEPLSLSPRFVRFRAVPPKGY